MLSGSVYSPGTEGGNMPTFTDIDDKIQFCFEAPTTPVARHARGGTVSVLYLLRRELVSVAGYTSDRDDEAIVEAGGVRANLFASLMLTFTGFDLLAKFCRGDGEKVGARFKRFLAMPGIVGVAPETAELLYQVRCSVVHAFGVPDSDSCESLAYELSHVAIARSKRTRGPRRELQIAIETIPGDTATIYVDGLFKFLRDSYPAVRESLYGSDSAPARTQFEAMFDKYGTMIVVA
jgi:hypothetical protein